MTTNTSYNDIIREAYAVYSEYKDKGGDEWQAAYFYRLADEALRKLAKANGEEYYNYGVDDDGVNQ